jgi:predicted acyl esterase
LDAIIGTGKISKREYDIITDSNISVPMNDGVNIKVDIYRPNGKGKFPALVGMSPFNKEYQREHVWPAPPMSKRVRGITNADLEAGPTDFFVRRGYVHIIGNVRGTGKSEGAYRYLDSREIRDVYELIEWAAKQPWCNGNVSMLGMAYFATHQPAVAALQPPHLKCIAPMFAFWDNYRYFWWTGGVLWSGFLRWLFSPDDMDIHTQKSVLRDEVGDDNFKEAISQALRDKDISADPALVDILRNPEGPGNAAILDILLHPTWGPYWQDRAVTDYSKIKIPAYLGVSGHRPGALYHWSDLKVPKKLISCSPAYVDRPFYQYSWELLRWYDYWLKGINTGIMDEPTVRLFIPGANEWLSADDWPLPNTKWIPFNLHENRSLCEIEPWPEASSASYDDAPGNRGFLKYTSAGICNFSYHLVTLHYIVIYYPYEMASHLDYWVFYHRHPH